MADCIQAVHDLSDLEVLAGKLQSIYEIFEEVIRPVQKNGGNLHFTYTANFMRAVNVFLNEKNFL
nr:DUF1871 family protein [Weizmannia acidilactici]